MKKIILIFTIILLILISSKNSNKNTKNNKQEFNKISYYNSNYKYRYNDYRKKHKNLSIKKIIKDVNMNLDKEEYNHFIKSDIEDKELILVNKYYYLEKDYIPKNLEVIDLNYSTKVIKLVSVAKKAFEEMATNAKRENLNIIAISGYRSYKYQETIYNNYVEIDGKEKADRYSARPGHSEHQTGLAIDIYNKEKDYNDFENTKEFIWMNKNAYKYGFILRFPKGKEKQTKYQYEPWHYRYVGKTNAKYIHDKNITLEEFYATKN